MKMRGFFAILLVTGLVFSCKSDPAPAAAPEKEPRSSLKPDRIEAADPDRVTLYFALRVENPRSVPLHVEVASWRVLFDGAALDAETAALGTPGRDGEGGGPDILRLEVPEGAAELPLALDIDLKKWGGEGEGTDECRAALTLDLSRRYGGEELPTETVGAEALFPRIRRPEFTITEIAILQAELVNTRFRVTVRIDNPNVFPVNLSSFGYELYGAGRFWADGKEKDVLRIPARDSAEVKLFLMMNFINMRRELLDEIIAMRQVRYRFSGEALVETDISWLPEFRMRFDRSGRSDVFR
ncbi:MAG: LEA type 2 family protein [Treponema sp.]|jgi:LEA14-like dessication related protein|nr:LEA type 2 family protein [Treponema sp.]